MKIALRDYQQDIVNRVRHEYAKGIKSVLMVSGTGSGKTIMFGHITREAFLRGKRVWIIAHRIEILLQIALTLDDYEVEYSIMAAGHRPDDSKQVQVCSVSSLARRMGSMHSPDLIVIDEAHHARAKTYVRIMEEYPDAFKLGVTASPERLDGKGLGDLFKSMVLGPTIREFIEQGHLCPYRMWSIPTMATTAVLKEESKNKRGGFGDFDMMAAEQLLYESGIMGDVMEHFEEYCRELRTVVFCCTVESAENMAQMFRESGYRAASIDGKMGIGRRLEIMEDYRTGELQVLTNCNIISEGVDISEIEAVLMCRPTQSLSMYLQQVGRSLRPCKGNPGKVAKILDFVGNYDRHKAPCLDRKWSLEGRKKREKDEEGEEIDTVTCPHCQGCQYRKDLVQGRFCSFPDCGKEVITAEELKERELNHVGGKLYEIDIEKAHKDARDIDDLLMEEARQSELRRLVSDASTYEEFEVLRKQLRTKDGRPYKKGWTYMQMKARGISRGGG